MASEFQSFIINREKCRDINGVKIIQRKSETEFNWMVEQALDRYITRLLQTYQCSVCQIETTKYCSNCGTYYCGIKCQKSDWNNHSLTCTGSSAGSYHSVEPLRSVGVSDKSEQPKSPSVKKEDKVKKNEINKKTESNLPGNVKTSSVQDVPQAVTKTAEVKKIANDGGKSDKGGGDAFDDSRLQARRLSSKANKKQFTLGQELTVMCVGTIRDTYWLFEERHTNEFKKIQKTLSENADSYPNTTNPKTGIMYSMKYNKQWYRCYVLSQDDKNLVRCIDTGTTFCPKFLNLKELPDDVKSVEPMTFRAEFDGQKPSASENEIFKVVVKGLSYNGHYKVKICEDKNKLNENSESKKKKKNEETEEDKKEVGKRKRSRKKEDGATVEQKIGKVRRSVVDELSPTSEGVFIPGTVANGTLFGCLVPDEVEDASHCCNKIARLHTTEKDRIDANVGEDVLIIGNDSLRRRGVVESKSSDTYQVRLIDYGHVVKTKEVYKLPEELAEVMELSCSITCPDTPANLLNAVEVNRPYVFFGLTKHSDGKWLCKLRNGSDSSSIISGTLDRVRKPKQKLTRVEFENGSKVIISSLGKGKSVFVKHAGGKYDDIIDKLNLRLNTMETDSDFDASSFRVGELVLARYRCDELWYRAKIIFKSADCTRVAFMDYGNTQESMPDELRPFPDEARNVPLFVIRVDLVGSGDSITPEGWDYLETVMKEHRVLTMTYNGTEPSKGVTLTDEDGIEINKIVFYQTSDGKISDSIKERFLNVENFPIGPVESFVLLHVDEKEFTENGNFWAANGKNKNFLYVMTELGHELYDQCLSDTESHSPEVGELCIAKFQDGWYRGLTKNRIGSSFEVFFVDFGNAEVLGPDMIRKMVPRFLDAPAIAVKCNLNGFQKLPKKKIKPAYTFISDNINNNLKGQAIVRAVNGNVNYVELPFE